MLLNSELIIEEFFVEIRLRKKLGPFPALSQINVIANHLLTEI